jgi:hypothetical protein
MGTRKIQKFLWSVCIMSSSCIMLHSLWMMLYFRTIYQRPQKKINNTIYNLSLRDFATEEAAIMSDGLFFVTVLVACRSQRTDPIVRPQFSQFMTQLFGISKKSLKIMFKIRTNSTFKYSRYYLWICVVIKCYKYSNVIKCYKYM